MSLMEELQGLGVDVDEALDRVMGDAETYEMMLGLFLNSVDENPIEQGDFGGGGSEALIHKVHMFKGVTGNLSITPLFTRYQEVLELLRAGKAKEAQAEYEELRPIQASIIACLKRHQTV